MPRHRSVGLGQLQLLKANGQRKSREEQVAESVTDGLQVLMRSRKINRATKEKLAEAYYTVCRQDMPGLDAPDVDITQDQPEI